MTNRVYRERAPLRVSNFYSTNWYHRYGDRGSVYGFLLAGGLVALVFTIIASAVEGAISSWWNLIPILMISIPVIIDVVGCLVTETKVRRSKIFNVYKKFLDLDDEYQVKLKPLMTRILEHDDCPDWCGCPDLDDNISLMSSAMYEIEKLKEAERKFLHDPAREAARDLISDVNGLTTEYYKILRESQK